MKSIESTQAAKVAVNILVNAYADAKNITWFLAPDRRKFQFFFSFLVDEAVAKNGAYLTSNERGVLLLYDLKSRHNFLPFLFRKLFLIFFILGLKKAIQLMQVQQLQKSLRPENGLYAMALAMQDDNDKWQTIFELKREFNALYETFNKPVYAETTNPKYAKIYESLGFVTYHQIEHPYTDLKIWFMKMEKEGSGTSS